MRRVTKSEYLALAEAWANEAGTSLKVRGTPDEPKILTNPDPTVRALWRCALQLARPGAQHARRRRGGGLMATVSLFIDARPILATIDRIMQLQLTPQLCRHAAAMLSDGAVYEIQPDGEGYRIVPSIQMLRLLEQYEGAEG